MSPYAFRPPGELGLPSRRLTERKSPTVVSIFQKDTFLKNLVWIYFILLIFEGALRKWFLPELSTPLLIVRDPIALAIVVITWQRGLFPVTPYLFGMVIIGFVGFFTAVLFGHGNLWVTLYGARIFLIHYPLIFSIGRIFTRDDVIQIGKATLWIAVPMAVLITFQFYSPQSAWVNRGVGGSLEGSGFSGALGFFRPSGTFSFTNGTTLFFGFAAVFILFFWIHRGYVNRMVLIAATVAMLLAVPLSISRSLFFGIGVSVAFTVVALIRNMRHIARIIPVVLIVVLLLAVLYSTKFFRQVLEVFLTRFESANEAEGGLQGVFLDRYLGGMIGALEHATTFPFFGYGLGLGTNVGSMLTEGQVLYLISEGEWGRLIGEMGPVLGIMVIVIRVGLCVKISTAAYSRLLTDDFLPGILLSFGLLVIPQSQWGQPTTLGFSSLVAGLLLASLRVRKGGERIQPKEWHK